MVKINKTLLPIKAHYFFFMAAMGPILPQLSVFGREMGISPVVMGSVTGVLPIAFLLAKPLFGLIVDVFRNFRKTIFVVLILTMSTSYALLYFVPARSLETYTIQVDCQQLDICNVTQFPPDYCNSTKSVTCSCETGPEPTVINGFVKVYNGSSEQVSVCFEGAEIPCESTCDLSCVEDLQTDTKCLYESVYFWAFVLFMSAGTIAFNVTNSVSDAICCDVIGTEYDYGKQRVWGTIGFGVTALASGYMVDLWSHNTISYRPAIICMLVFTALDLASCIKLKLPIIETPKHIFQDLRRLLNNRQTMIFILFSVFAGIVDGFIVYFLFWYLEDLAVVTETQNIKLLEGLVVAAETLGGEVVFFYLSGVILDRFGHARTFSMCFICYALRLGLISVVPTPWWILPVEFALQGPTYALTYATIVQYANVIAPEGMSATMQGIAAGMDDGFGYALGSFIGGLLYKYVGGKGTFQIFSSFALFCSIAYLILHATVLREREVEINDRKHVEYHVPLETDPPKPEAEKC